MIRVGTGYTSKDQVCKPGEKLPETGPVSGKFCTSLTGDKGNIGLLDESVKAAQAQYNIDFILNANFWQESGCISVEGVGAKIASAGNVANPITSSAVPAPKVKPLSKKKK